MSPRDQLDDLAEPGRRFGLSEVISTPALDLVCLSQCTAVLFTGGNIDSRSQGLRDAALVFFVAPPTVNEAAIV
jgi:hypothetical protein